MNETTGCPEDQCSAVEAHGDHLRIRIYRRPIFRLFRKTQYDVCTRCDLLERVK